MLCPPKNSISTGFAGTLIACSKATSVVVFCFFFVRVRSISAGGDLPPEKRRGASAFQNIRQISTPTDNFLAFRSDEADRLRLRLVDAFRGEGLSLFPTGSMIFNVCTGVRCQTRRFFTPSIQSALLPNLMHEIPYVKLKNTDSYVSLHPIFGDSDFPSIIAFSFPTMRRHFLKSAPFTSRCLHVVTERVNARERLITRAVSLGRDPETPAKQRRSR